MILLLTRTEEAFRDGADVDTGLAASMREHGRGVDRDGPADARRDHPVRGDELIPIRELGIGVSVAVLLDVVLVRPVLLPAAIEVMGRGGWWPTHVTEGKPADRPAHRARTNPLRHRPTH